MYDYLIVGSGLFGATCAYELTRAGKKCLVVEKRDHIGGNVYTENIEGINVHKYGAHIFHTSDKEIWEYINRFAEFNNYVNTVIARYEKETYNLPFNMNTFVRLWEDVFTPEDAQKKIEQERKAFFVESPENLEQQAINLVGKTIYEKLIKGYTEKQWGKPCNELPPFIIKRLPVRFTFNNNYFNDRYQGIPIGGYTQIIEKMLEGVEVRTGVDFIKDRATLAPLADKIIYTGAIDEYFNYQFGRLEYRSLRFETEVLDKKDYQGNAVINYTEYEVPFTRIIEHKHFEFGDQEKTVITREYPLAFSADKEPYYPVNDEKNNALYAKYAQLAAQDDKVLFGGRLGGYKYMDMHQILRLALDLVERELHG